MRTAALNWLVQQPLASQFPNVLAGAKTRFREALSDKTPAAALSAVRGLWDSEPDTQPVVETLTRLISSPTESAVFPGFRTEVEQLQGEALKLAAVMGPRAVAAVPAIAPFLLLRDSPTGQQAFSIGSTSAGGPGAIQLSIKSLAALALARIGKGAIAALPTVEEALKQFEGDRQSIVEPPSGAFGAMVGDMARGMARGGQFQRSVTIRELLIAAKAQLEDRAPPDPEKKATEVKMEDILLVQSLHKLLLTEQVLLDQHYGPGSERPELRELDQKLKAAEEELNAVWTLYNEQRKNAPRKSAGSTSEPNTKAKPSESPKNDETK